MNRIPFYFLKVLAFVVIGSALSACATQSAPTVRPMPMVLSFEDFGPPELGAELLGENTYPWPDRDNQLDIPRNVQVIVYKAGDLEQVRADYAPNREQKVDYRYVEHLVARSWLEEQMAKQEIALQEGGEIDRDATFNLLKRLYSTLLSIEQNF